MPRRRLALPLVLVLLAGAALAGPQPVGEPVDQLIQRSGIAAQLANFEGSMQAGIDSAHGVRRDLSSEQVERLRKAVAKAYAASSLRPVLRSEIAKRLTRAEIAATLAWLDSPVGHKLATLEAQAATPQSQQRIEKAVRGAAPDVPPARAQTLHQLIRATHADEVGASLLIETAAAIFEGTGYTDSTAVASLRRELESRRRQIVAEMHARSFTSFAVVYAQASDADLAALLAFTRSPAGVKYHAASAGAFQSTLVYAARRLGEELAVPVAPAAPAGN